MRNNEFSAAGEPWEQVLQRMLHASRAIRDQHHNEPLALLGVIYCLRKICISPSYFEESYNNVLINTFKNTVEKVNQHDEIIVAEQLDYLLASIESVTPYSGNENTSVALRHLFSNLRQFDFAVRSEWLKLSLTDWPLEGFSSWFESRLDGLKIEGLHGTPATIKQLFATLFANEKPSSIYDPACGTGGLLSSVGIALGQQANFSGQEESSEAWAWAVLRFWITGQDVSLANRNALKADTFQEHGQPMSFGLIVSNPPFGAQLNSHNLNLFSSRLISSISNRVSSEVAYIHEIYNRLNSTGIAAVIVPNGFLFRTGVDERLRKALIDGDTIEAVIGLPARLFAPMTNIETAILVINKSKPDKRRKQVLFVDARDLGLKEGSRIILQEAVITKIAVAYTQWISEAGFSAIATLDQVEQQSFSLPPARYVKSETAQPLTERIDRRKRIAILDKRHASLKEEYEALRDALMLYLQHPG